MTARARRIPAAIAVTAFALLALAGCALKGHAAQDVASGLPAGAGCMVEITTPGGHATYYKPGRDQRIVVPNGTPHPYVARCINGAITAQPGSGDLPS